MIVPKKEKPKDPKYNEQQQAQYNLYLRGLATKPSTREVPQKNSWGTPVASRQ